MQQLNQPTQAILQKYGISPTPNPQQAVSGNAQVRNINTSTVNNQINNKIIIIQPQIPISQPNIQIRDTQGETLRNWISNQFKSQQQKYQEESDFYKKYSERISDGIQRVTKSVASATERFAENMNPQRLSRTMTDSKKVLLMLSLGILATKFIGPLTRRIDKFYSWFVGDKDKKGFVEKFKDIFFPDDKNNGILGKLKKGISYGFSLLRGYLDLAIKDRVRALDELKNHDLGNVDLFDITAVPSLLLKVFTALIGGSKALGKLKLESAGSKVKKKVIKWFSRKYSPLKNDFNLLGNVKEELPSVQRVQKKIEELIQKVLDSKFTKMVGTVNIPTVQILGLLEALSKAVFTCYQKDEKLVRGTVINNANNFLTLLGYTDIEKEYLFKEQYIVDIKSVVKDRDEATEVTDHQAITSEGWDEMAKIFGGKKVSVSDKKYYETFESRLLDKWKSLQRLNFAEDESGLAAIENVKVIDTDSHYYRDEVEELKRAQEFSDELEAARQADQEIFEHENKEALGFFRDLENSFYEDEGLSDVDRFNESNYSQSSGEFNPQKAAQLLRENSHYKYHYNTKIGEKEPSTSSGHCAGHVRLAVEGAGVPLEGHPQDAYQYMNFLPTKGFKLIHSGRKRDLKDPNTYPFMDDLRQGDIVVFNRTSSHPHGHIAMYDGQRWYSDYSQNTWHGMLDKGFDQFGIFRFDKEIGTPKVVTTADYEKQVMTHQSTQQRVSYMMQTLFSKKSDTLPESAAPSNSPVTTEGMNIGATLGEVPTPPPGVMSADNPTTSGGVYGQTQSDIDVAANPEVSVYNYARKGVKKQVTYHNTMMASYVNSVTNN